MRLFGKRAGTPSWCIGVLFADDGEVMDQKGFILPRRRDVCMAA